MLSVYAKRVCDNVDLHKAAYDLLLDAMRLELGLEIHTSTIKKSQSGKPYFLGCPYHFSITHTDGLVAVAISDLPVGIDAESKNRRISNAVAFRFLRKDTASIEDWTRYEAVGKMLGCGVPLNERQREGTYPTYYYDELSDYTVCCVCRSDQMKGKLKLV